MSMRKRIKHVVSIRVCLCKLQLKQEYKNPIIFSVIGSSTSRDTDIFGNFKSQDLAAVFLLITLGSPKSH